MTDVNFPQDFYLDDVGVWRLKKEKLAELEKPKPMTNEEWFASLTTEEKARFFDKICYSAWGDRTSRFRDMADYTDWVEWLKEKHE